MDGELLADQPLGQKLIKKWFWLYFFTILIAPTAYFIRVLVSNNVSVADVGIIYSIIWFITILSAYHDLWLTEALQYHLPKYRIKKQYNAFKTSIFFTLIIQAVTGITIAFILFFWANFLAIHYFHSPESAHIIKIFCLYFLGINFFNMFYSTYIAFQDVIQYKIIEWIKWYTTLIFTLIFFLLGTMNITNFAWAWIIGLGASIVISWIIFFKKYSYALAKWHIERETTLIKKQMKYAFRVFIGINIIYLLGQVDQQFVIYFLWPEKAWYYAIYLSLIYAFNIITWPLLWYLFPLTTELIEKKEYDKLKQIKNIFYKYLSIFAISISGLFIVLWPEIATILFGQKFLYSWQLLAYSWAFLIFNILFNANFSLMACMGKVKQRAKITWIALFTNIILNIFFIQIRWIIGVIASTTIAWIILFILSQKLVNNQKEILFDWSYFIKNLISIIMISSIIYYFKEKIFVLEDIYRYKNLFYFILISIAYYICILGINYKNISTIWKTIQNIRWNK